MTTCRRPAEGLRRVGSFIAVLALLLQLGVSVRPDSAGAAAAAPWLGMPLCHAAPGHAPAAPAAPDQACQCALCFLMQAGGVFLAPPDPAGVAPDMVALRPLPRPAPFRLAQEAAIAAQPRAPPASV